MGSVMASHPLEVLAIDFTLLEAADNKMENVLVMTDVFTKFAVAVPTRNQTAATTAKVLVREWFLRYGVVERIHSDQGRNFESRLIQELCKLYNVKRSHTTPYSPQGNGGCERFNRTLHTLLCTLEPQQKRKWPEYLPMVVAYYNSTPHAATGYSPFYLMFGRNSRLPTDYLLGTGQETLSNSDWVAEHASRLRAAQETANRNLDEDRERRKKHYDQKAQEWLLDVGTKVYTIDRSKVGRNKIGDFYKDKTYIIVDRKNNVYTIKQTDGKQDTRRVNRKEITPVPIYPEPTSSPGSSAKEPVTERKTSGRSSRNSGIDSSDEDDSGSEYWLELSTVPLRRSRRRGAGTHSNPFNQPRSVLS
jgi:transposase InsO family protein